MWGPREHSLESQGSTCCHHVCHPPSPPPCPSVAKVTTKIQDALLPVLCHQHHHWRAHHPAAPTAGHSQPQICLLPSIRHWWWCQPDPAGLCSHPGRASRDTRAGQGRAGVGPDPSPLPNKRGSSHSSVKSALASALEHATHHRHHLAAPGKILERGIEIHIPRKQLWPWIPSRPVPRSSGFCFTQGQLQTAPPPPVLPWEII